MTVGLRAAITNSFMHLPFFLVLAAIGVPGSVYLGVSAIHLLVMTWLHTERIGRLPRLSRWLNTPALHRIHHSAAPEHEDDHEEPEQNDGVQREEQRVIEREQDEPRGEAAADGTELTKVLVSRSSD